jgi:CRISPR/Cas system-associated protein Csx1
MLFLLSKVNIYNINLLQNKYCLLQLKGTPLRSKSLKTQNLNFLHREVVTLKTERYAKDNKEICPEIY